MARPKFQIGEVVRNRHGVVGTIEAAYLGLEEAAAAGVITGAAGWFARQKPRPNTSRHGFWYTVRPERGLLLCGEDDLELASPTS